MFPTLTLPAPDRGPGGPDTRRARADRPAGNKRHSHGGYGSGRPHRPLEQNSPAVHARGANQSDLASIAVLMLGDPGESPHCRVCGLGATIIATRAPLSALYQSSFLTSTVESLNIMYPACESASPIVPSIIMLSRSGATRPRPRIRISGSIGA